MTFVSQNCFVINSAYCIVNQNVQSKAMNEPEGLIGTSKCPPTNSFKTRRVACLPARG